METDYLNLIAESYIKLTKENDDNLALFFFQKYSKLKRKNGTPKNRFYNKLIENIENLINNSYNKAKEPDLSGIPDEHRIDQENELKRKEINYVAAMNQYSDYCAEEGLPNNTPNWEICTDATKLTNALNNEYVKLKDPINIITPSKKTSKKELIVRKSKLEYLKSEAERASKVTLIDELDEIPVIETPAPSVVGTSPNKNDGSIKTTVQNAFKFTLEKNPDNNKIILSKENYDNLVKWVTLYYENEIGNKKDYKLPIIDSPLKEANIGITYIRFAFKELNDELNPKSPRPKSFYKFVGSCFINKGRYTEKLITGTRQPTYYEKLIAPRKPYKDQ